MRMNPVYKNELKMSARSMQLPVLAVIFNSILSVVALIALYGIRQRRKSVSFDDDTLCCCPDYRSGFTLSFCTIGSRRQHCR